MFILFQVAKKIVMALVLVNTNYPVVTSQLLQKEKQFASIKAKANHDKTSAPLMGEIQLALKDFSQILECNKLELACPLMVQFCIDVNKFNSALFL